jgi:hypothetical protein
MFGGGQRYNPPGAIVPAHPFEDYGHGHGPAYGQMPIGGPPPSPNSFTTARSHESFVTAEGSPQSSRSSRSSRSSLSSRSRSSRGSRSPPSPGAPGAHTGHFPANLPAGANSGYYPNRYPNHPPNRYPNHAPGANTTHLKLRKHKKK